MPTDDGCSYCDRTISECDSEPAGFEDKWSHSKDGHYTVDVWCEGKLERDEDNYDGPSEPDFNDYEADRAADAWERSQGL